MVVALVLGPMMEKTLRQALFLTRGSVVDLVARPLSATILILAAAALFRAAARTAPARETPRVARSARQRALAGERAHRNNFLAFVVPQPRHAACPCASFPIPQTAADVSACPTSCASPRRAAWVYC